MRYIVLLLTFTALTFGQSAPSIMGITNAALPGMDAHVPIRLQARSMATIFGTNLSTTTTSTAPPWVTVLGGTALHLVPLSTGCGTANPPANLSCELVADLIFVSPTQINFIVPDVSPSAYGQQELAFDVILVENGQRFDTGVSFYLSPVGDFAVFQVGYDCDFSLSLSYPDACGYSQTPGQNKVPIGAVTDVSGNLVTSNNPIHQGQIVVLWATGLASLSVNQSTGLLQQASPTPLAFAVTQSNPNGASTILTSYWQSQPPIWAGESPSYIGLDQINLTFPTCTGAVATTEQRYDVLMTFNAPSADSNLGVGFSTLYIPFIISPGEVTCQFGAPSTTALVSSANPSLPGQPLTLTATISPSDATGTVTFFDGVAILATETLDAGKASCGATATCNTSGLAAGTHSIMVTYSGDSKYGRSSAILNQSIVVATTTTLVSNTTSATFGQPLTLTAIISPNNSVVYLTGTETYTPFATGTVTFLDGGSAIASGAVGTSNGIISATGSTSSLSVGTHSITAHYSGDNYNNASTSLPLTETVTAGKVSLSISYSPSTVVAGQTVTFTVALSNNAATGTIALFDSTTSIGSGRINNGQAIFPTTLTGGSHTITANYSGDSNFGSTFISISVTVTVPQIPTTITITSNTNPSVYSGSNGWANVTLTASVSPYFNGSDGTGVTFYATNTGASSGPNCYRSFNFPGCQMLDCNGSGSVLSEGKATCVVSGNLFPGTSSIVAMFSGDNQYALNGDNDYLASTSSPISQTVNMPLTASLNPAVVGQSVSFYVTTGWPFSSAGVMTFYDGATVLGVGVVSAPVSSAFSSNAFVYGSASFTTTSLAVGSHAISAVYTPTPGLVVATSQILNVTITTH